MYSIEENGIWHRVFVTSFIHWNKKKIEIAVYREIQNEVNAVEIKTNGTYTDA
jgi:hypothetical protein